MKATDYTKTALIYAESRADRPHLQQILAEAYLAGAKTATEKTVEKIANYLQQK